MKAEVKRLSIKQETPSPTKEILEEKKEIRLFEDSNDNNNKVEGKHVTSDE